VHRQLKVELGASGPGPPVFDVTGQAGLSGIEVDRGDLLSGPQQRERDVHGDRGFAGAAFFISDHDHVRRECLRIIKRRRLDFSQHGPSDDRISYSCSLSLAGRPAGQEI
jgi:hypothetical protein